MLITCGCVTNQAYLRDNCKNKKTVLGVTPSQEARTERESELVKVYASNVRSSIEYASIVYGPMLTGEQIGQLERLQNQCLKFIYGFNKSSREVLEISALESLEARRPTAIEKIARKCTETSTVTGFRETQKTPGKELGTYIRKNLPDATAIGIDQSTICDEY